MSLFTVKRRATKAVRLADIGIGGAYPVTVQSMTKTDTRDVVATARQIRDLEAAGCQIVRCAVPDLQAAEALGEIKKAISIPLVADIHFDYRLALIALEQGVDKLRINPGNIGDRDRVRQVAEAAAERQVPIRIGVNAGSLEKPLLERFGSPTPEAMVESALGHIRILEELGFTDIVVSLKASDVVMTVRAYRLLAEKTDYPLHLGITEAGTPFKGTIRSAAGIGALLIDGIGDTIRVSLTGPPAEEVNVGHELLKSVGLSSRGPIIISCPTCGRCQVDLVSVALAVEKRLENLRTDLGQPPLKVAIMGCAVNGPGEAREADVGLAGGLGQGLIFRQGRIVARVSEDEMVEALCREVEAAAKS